MGSHISSRPLSLTCWCLYYDLMFFFCNSSTTSWMDVYLSYLAYSQSTSYRPIVILVHKSIRLIGDFDTNTLDSRWAAWAALKGLAKRRHDKLRFNRHVNGDICDNEQVGDYGLTERLYLLISYTFLISVHLCRNGLTHF